MAWAILEWHLESMESYGHKPSLVVIQMESQRLPKTTATDFVFLQAAQQSCCLLDLLSFAPVPPCDIQSCKTHCPE
jgi:hypothetical protein